MSERTERSRAFLDEPEIHEEWESDFLNPDLDPFYDAVFARIVAELGARPGDTILDAGCGSCFHAARLASHGLRVIGLDLSSAALASARARLDREGIRGVDLAQGDLRALPFSDGALDFANCWGVLMHVPDLETALSELARILRPGGRLSLMENNLESLHVRGWDRLLRLSKRALGRRVHEVHTTPRGLEEWRDEGLMVRRTDMRWLVDFYRDRGVRLRRRFAGQFTELYTTLPGRPLRRAVYRFNEMYSRLGGPAGLALGNVLVFEKEQA